MSYIREVTDDGIVDPKNEKAVVKPFVLSHGTLGCRDLAKTRKFYEEFLGLECVQHGVTSMVFRCGLKFHVVCVAIGEEYPSCHVHNHWGLDVQTRAEVDAAYEAAVKKQDEYGLAQIMTPEDHHGVYSFYFVDRDRNWWEIQHYPGFQDDDMFDFGDRFTPDGKPVGQENEPSPA
ncbi:VOC family protein [Bradyrhizobium jicamae]|uniref:VOC family protein n=1 Tax=Bradyrhizobium jicamae TaxID=280332 RepID=UPI001BA93B82|nr:VOC family protein [Bradyrhizobium jicamae]MBR0754348.1 VOC family protein [Bradyrhizobium jicamae]